MMAPLKIPLSGIQKQMVQAAILVHAIRNEPILGSARPVVVGETLVADPTDFVCLMAFVQREPQTEIEAFRVRAVGISEMESRLVRCKRDSTKMAYQQLIAHARETFPIGSALESEPPPARRPARIWSREAITLVPANPPR